MYYLMYQIHTLEPVKMGSQNRSENTEYALDYIAGSSVRGALLGGYCRKNKINLSREPEIKRHLLKDVFYLNAYPAAGAQRAIPAPLSFMGQKQELSQYNGESIEVKSIFGDPDELKPGDRAVKKESFALLSSDRVQGVKVKKSFKLHISVNGRNQKKERTMFRYEALSEGQNFIGYIASEDKELLNQYQCLLEENPIYYVGGSKGSGYGKCRITSLGYTEESPCEISRSDWNGKNEFYVYMLSDAVIYDREGFPVNYIPTEILAKYLELDKVEYDKGASDVTRITGYNSTWKAAKPQYMGIKGGSVFHYTFDGSLEGKENLIHALEDRGTGIMRQEGFGRFMILPAMPQKHWEGYRMDEKRRKVTELSEENQKQARMMMAHLYYQQVRRGIDRKVVNTAEGTTHSQWKRTQVSHILNIVEYGFRGTPEDFQKGMTQYFKEMEDKKNNPAAFRFFNNEKVGSKSLMDYLLDCANTAGDVDAFIAQEEFKINLAAQRIGFRPSREDVYRYNLEYLDKFVRYLLPSEGGKNA